MSALALNENCGETKSIETNFPDGCLDAQGFGVAHQRQDIFSILLAGDHGTAELHHKMQATATELIQHVKAFKPCTLKRRHTIWELCCFQISLARELLPRGDLGE